MKIWFFLSALILSSSVLSQGWIDSVRKARQLYLNKEYNKARQFYLNSNHKLINKVDLSDEMAQTYFRKKKYLAASKYYSKMLGKSNLKDRVRKLYNLGNAYDKQQDYINAMDSYKKVLKLDPFHERARYNLSQVIRKLKNNPSPENKNNPKEQKKEEQDKKAKDQKNQKNKNKTKDQKKEENSPKKEQAKNQKPSSTRKNAIDRMLKNLLKQEARTKSKLNKLKENTPNQDFNGKDW